MDFPLMFIDSIAGGRLIIGLIASLHVLINHPLAVGVYPILTYIEWWAFKNNNKRLDDVAYNITFVVFIVTTTVGALTGVGIWVTTALFAPFAIGSLLRVFFWGWLAEWLVFISEVILIMWWFLAWKSSDHSDAAKTKHIKIGMALSIMSWLTMALIVTVLGFMMKPGDWNQTRAFWDAMTNPLYLPQLGFRTFFSLMTGAVFIWFASFFFTKNDVATRHWLIFRLSFVTLFSLFMTLGFGVWYWSRIPDVMQANSSVALLTQAFMGWHSQFYWLLVITIIGFLTVSLGGIFFTKRIPRYALLIPTFMGIWLLGHFERSREFMRKPWVIGEYLYSNGIRKDELAFFQEKGILPYATYVSHREVTVDNKIEAGKDVFMLACSRCHSTIGVNGVVNKFNLLYGDKDWNPEAMVAFIRSMHASRTFMPPFPGNNSELEALVAYLTNIKDTKTPLVGAQTRGASLPIGENSRLTFRFEEGDSNDPNAIFVEGVGVGR
jgi:mono/diheme cytochrome c family protein